jgi:hypothetical protein
VVVVQEGIHILELVRDFGRCLSCPVVVELLISVVLVFPCFYYLSENAPYSRVKVFCHFPYSSSPEHSPHHDPHSEPASAPLVAGRASHLVIILPPPRDS